MRHAVTAVLILFWLVIGYSGLLWVARRFLTGPYRAQAATIAVLAAFFGGIALRRTLPASPTVPEPVAARAVPGAVQAVSANDVSFEVGSVCRLVRLRGAGGKGNIDGAKVQAAGGSVSADSRGPLHKGDLLVVSGWAAGPELKTPSRAVCIVIDGRIISGIRIVYGEDRPDVSQAYQVAALEPTGFEATIPAGRLGAGAHTIQAAAVAGDGSAAVVSGNFRVVGPADGPRS